MFISKFCEEPPESDTEAPTMGVLELFATINLCVGRLTVTVLPAWLAGAPANDTETPIATERKTRPIRLLRVSPVWDWRNARRFLLRISKAYRASRPCFC